VQQSPPPTKDNIMHSSTHSSARPVSVGFLASIESAFDHVGFVLSSMTQRVAQTTLLEQADRLTRSHPETAAKMRKAAQRTWE
jgi:hypothetical protein